MTTGQWIFFVVVMTFFGLWSGYRLSEYILRDRCINCMRRQAQKLNKILECMR